MEQIGRYQILDEVGRGAMGVVYRAQDPAIGRIIAIKTIRLTDLTDPEERERLRERLFREAQSAGILSHPNIVTIYDIAEQSGQACIFMEFVNGPPLERLLAAKELPAKQTFLQILRQTAAALDYAHRKGIVHRDIKPSNIMIHEDGQAKITDFGVAKIISQQMTQGGGMMGTPNYMSPEQVQGLAVDGRADQFALGVIAYELLTGEKPFAGDYLPTLLYKIVREEPAPPQRLNPSLSGKFETVLHRGLAKNPQDRYATCTEFVNALVDACDGTPGWTPLPRGSSQSLPTMAGLPGQSAPAELKAPPVAGVAIPPRPPRRSDTDRNPLVKSLVWVLVGIGLLGLVLLGAQKFLFNPQPVTTAEQNPPATPPAQLQPAPSAKPSPVTPGPEKPAAVPEGAAGAGADQKGTPEKLPGEEATDEKEAQPETAKQGVESSTVEKARDVPVRTAPANSGPDRSVQLLTDPPRAKVTVDGDPSKTCVTPCMIPMQPGRHTLNTQLDGYRSYPRIFNVPEDSDLFLKLTKVSGTISVTSVPPGASIQINGDLKSQKTPAAFAVSPGDYHIRVVRNGVPVEFDVQVKDGEFQTREVKFQ